METSAPMRVNYTDPSLPSAAAAANEASGKGQITSDFTTFLKMLTVQLQNQDPLNPMDSTDFSVQLATFSGVEQQVQTNTLLQGLATQFSVMGMAQLAGWVGQEARAPADVVVFDGEPVTLSPNPVLGADRVVLAVYNEAGTLVAREDLPVSSAPYEWLGKDVAGASLPAGRYVLSLHSLRGDETLATAPVEYYAPVIEARGGTNGAILVLKGGVEVAASDVTALRGARLSAPVGG